MNHDDILRMGTDCGLTIHGELMLGVEHFAALIAAAEREACALIVDPTEHHRRNASIYLGGDEGVELLEQTAEDIRARGQ